MNLPDVPKGAAVFVDANIFIYAVEHRSPQCRQLLDQIDDGDVRAFSSAIVVAEVGHRRMINEAREAGLVTGSNSARLLGRNPELRQKFCYPRTVGGEGEKGSLRQKGCYPGEHG